MCRFSSRAETAVAAALDGQQAVRQAGAVEGLVQADGVGVGHDAVGVAVDGQDGRNALAHVGQGRHPGRHLAAVAAAAQPGLGEVARGARAGPA